MQTMLADGSGLVVEARTWRRRSATRNRTTLPIAQWQSTPEREGKYPGSTPGRHTTAYLPVYQAQSRNGSTRGGRTTPDGVQPVGDWGS